MAVEIQNWAIPRLHTISECTAGRPGLESEDEEVFLFLFLNTPYIEKKYRRWGSPESEGSWIGLEWI